MTKCGKNKQVAHEPLGECVANVLKQQWSIYLRVPPASPASQTHKFPKRRTNLVMHASIWTQKITIPIMFYVFSSLERTSDRIRWCGTRYFANIRIIRAFSHIKGKNHVHISDKAASLQPQKQKFRSDWLFWIRFSPKTATKTRQFVCDEFLTFRPLTDEPGD